MSSLQKFSHLQVLLERCFDPTEILDDFPQEFGIYKEPGMEIRNAPDRVSKVKLFIMALEKFQVDDSNIINQFLDALARSSYAWIVPLLNDSDEYSDFTELILQVEEQDKLKNILNVIFPALKVIKVDEFLRHISSIFSEDEREEISNMAQNHNNSYGLFGLMNCIITKKYAWIDKFTKACRDLNYQPSSMFQDSSYQNLADVLEDFIGYLPESNEDEHMEIEGTHSETPELMNEKLPEQIPLEDMQASPCKWKLDDLENEQCSNYNPEDKDFIQQEDHSETEINSSSEKPQWKLRNYQEELCKEAICGENVIICAPTGSGKTLVAAHIIKSRINISSPEFKVAFFTPTAGLTNQQHQKLKEYLPNLKISVVCGNTDGTIANLKKEIFTSAIVVLTPQIMINALEDNSVHSVFTFSLMIFDECHHACKGHPYNNILYHYLTTKRGETENSLQIIGLTATLGIGKTANLDKAMEHILLLCGSLDCRGGIITVKKYCDDLNGVCPEAAEETIPVKTNEDQAFKKHLIKTQEKIGHILDELEATQHKGVAKPDFKTVSTEQLEQWCSTLRRNASMIQDSNDNVVGRNIISCADALKSLVDACDIYNYCQPADAIETLEKSLTCFDEKREKNTKIEHRLHTIIQEAIEALRQYSKDSTCVNENLLKIEEKIIGKLKKDPSSRIMVMVPKRLFAQALKDWMNSTECLEILKCEMFIGTGSNCRSDVPGLTHPEQTKIMQRFNAGEVKVLICTPEAAGEGLDIENCNLVINYNYMRNEISSIQTKGRARQKNSQVIQLSSEKVCSKDKLNLVKFYLMQRATREVQKLYKNNKEEYLQKLKNCQFNTVVALKTSKMKSGERAKSSGQVYDVRCRKCSMYVCCSNEIQLVNGNQYTIFGEAIKEKYDQTEHPDKNSKAGSPDVVKLYKIQCSDCKHDWGIISCWKGVIELPAVKVKAFKFINVGKPILPSKWKNVPFTPENADLEKVCVEMGFDI